MTDTVNQVGGAIITGLTATGTNQGTALQLANRAGLNEVTTVNSSTGVSLPAPRFLGMAITIANQGSHALAVYPQLGGTIDNGTVNASASLGAGKTITYEASSLTNWYTTATTASSGSAGITGLTGDVTTPSGSSGSVAAFLAGQSNVVSASISASQNNWSPTGLLTAGALTANLIRVSPTAIRVGLTGLAAPSAGTIDGAIVTVQNAIGSGFPLRMFANSASSSAGNKFAFLSDVFLAPGESLVLQYDASGSAWRELHPHRDRRTDLYGSAADGSPTITTQTLSRSWYFDNLTIPASTVLTCQGYDIYVNDTLDISGASTGSIVWNGATGGTGTLGGAGGSAGATAVAANPVTLSQDIGRAGGAGGINAGTAGAAGIGRACYNALAVAQAGTGGAGGTGAGAGGGSIPISTALAPALEFKAQTTGNAVAWFAGQGASGGGGGGGDATNSGGGGGGSGATGGGLRIFARNIFRGTNTNVGIFQALGGAGGAGGAGAGTGNTGGGGGGAGGQGGTVEIYYGSLFGSQIASAIDVTGGNGGNGGAKGAVASGASAAGGGGVAGSGGYVLLFSNTTGSATATAGAARAAGSGATGGTATTSQAAL